MQNYGWFGLCCVVLFVGKSALAVDWVADVANKPFVDVRNFSPGSTGTAGIQEAIDSLAQRGGVVFLPAGTYNITGPITIKYNNITLLGAGSGSTDPTLNGGGPYAPGATEVFWNSSSTVAALISIDASLTINNSVEGARILGIRFHANNKATTILQVKGCNHCEVSSDGFLAPASNGTAVTINALPNQNNTGNTAKLIFRGNYMRADVAGGACLRIGTTATNAHNGNWGGEFAINHCVYKNDSSTSVGLELAWADNNKFINNTWQASGTGSGYALKLSQQSGAYNWMPSANTFVSDQLGALTTVNAIGGTSGTGKTFFMPYQLFDSGTLPTFASDPNLVGFTDQGGFFGNTSNLQNRFTIDSSRGLGGSTPSNFFFRNTYSVSGSETADSMFMSFANEASGSGKAAYVYVNPGAGTGAASGVTVSRYGTVGIGNSSPGYLLAVGSGAFSDGMGWYTTSDRNMKEHFKDLDPLSVLAKIDSLPVRQWTYKGMPDATHIGPVAQDFHSIFGVGNSDKAISAMDVGGISLVGVQALSAKVNAAIEKHSEGYATISRGSVQVRVSLRGERKSPPVVNLTPMAFLDGQYRLAGLGKNEFTIELSKPQQADVSFSWQENDQ